MKTSLVLMTLLVAFGLLAGCGAEDTGTKPPERKAMSTDEMQTLPPEAQKAAQNAQKAGDFQSKRMQEMADAQRKAQGGK